MTKAEREKWRLRLHERFEASGMKQDEFSRMLVRDSRTLRRWLSGESPIPRAVRDWLAEDGWPDETETEPYAWAVEVLRRSGDGVEYWAPDGLVYWEEDARADAAWRRGRVVSLHRRVAE